jgi:hypothetical protein
MLLPFLILLSYTLNPIKLYNNFGQFFYQHEEVLVHTVIQILNLLKIHQDAIESALQADPPLPLLPQIRTTQTAFEKLHYDAAALPNDKSAFTPVQRQAAIEIEKRLIGAANDLLRLFLRDETLTEIVTRPVGDGRFADERSTWDHPTPTENMPLKGVANEFYLFTKSLVDEKKNVKKNKKKKNNNG